jgi:hypothetical protein
MRAAAVMAAIVVMGACGDTAERATTARVVVDVSPASPVSFVASTSFQMVIDETTFETNPVFNNTDSLSLTDAYDETYALDAEFPQFYAQLKNDSSTPEAVRMRVFLDGVEAYDVSVTMANGGNLEYVYQFQSPGGNR